MKFFIDLLPVILFFIAYKAYDIYTATAVLIVSYLVYAVAAWIRHRRVDKMMTFMVASVLIFGGLTLLLRDPTFIKWKPTVVNWCFAVAFLGSHFIGDKTLLERIMSHAIQVSGSIWSRVNMAWVIFFAAMGIINLYVAYTFDEDTWVNFKLFGMMGLTLVFVIGQSFYLARFVEADQGTEGKS